MPTSPPGWPTMNGRVWIMRPEALTPEVVLIRTLRKKDRIRSVTVLMEWDDGSYDADWSKQKVSDLCFAAWFFEDQAKRVVRGDCPEVLVEPPEPTG